MHSHKIDLKGKRANISKLLPGWLISPTQTLKRAFLQQKCSILCKILLNETKIDVFTIVPRRDLDNRSWKTPSKQLKNLITERLGKPVIVYCDSFD